MNERKTIAEEAGEAIDFADFFGSNESHHTREGAIWI